MASIQQRGSFYQVQVRRKDSTPLSKCFKSLTEAKSWARQIEAAIDMGNSPIAQVRNSQIPTLHEALTRYELEILPSKKCGFKELSFTKRLKLHALATKPLHKIAAYDVASYRDELLQAGLAKSSVVRHLAVASHLFTIAIKEWGLSLDNPVLKIRKPRVANARSRRPSQEELKLVLANLPTEDMRAFVQLACETAMRRSELIGLTWNHIDLGNRFVHLTDTKNGCSRALVISSKAVEIFIRLKEAKTGPERVFSFAHRDTPSNAFGCHDLSRLNLRLLVTQIVAVICALHMPSCGTLPEAG